MSMQCVQSDAVANWTHTEWLLSYPVYAGAAGTLVLDHGYLSTYYAE